MQSNGKTVPLRMRKCEEQNKKLSATTETKIRIVLKCHEQALRIITAKPQTHAHTEKHIYVCTSTHSYDDLHVDYL